MTVSMQTSSCREAQADKSTIHAVTQTKEENRAAGNKTTENRKNVFFGDTMLAEKNPVEVRRKIAQKKAMKIIQDAYAGDAAIDKQVNDRINHYEEMAAVRETASNELRDLNQQQKELQKEYGVSDDGEEQKNLELLKKEQDIQNNVTKETLSGEEMEQLAQIHKNPLTEYQSRALGLNQLAAKSKLAIADAQKQMNGDTADMKSIYLERLKSDPMQKAQKSAEDILEAAGKEIQNMLVGEAKDVMDEKTEEEKEWAKEKSEEKKEEEKIIEEREEKQAVEQALMEKTKEAVEEAKAKQQKNDAPEIKIDEMIEITNPSDTAKTVSESLDEIKNRMKLLEADLKGITVDEEV